MKSNITFLTLNEKSKKEIAINLADRLEMFYIDINEFLDYQLGDKEEVISKAGREYYIQEEMKIVKSISSYENTLITLDSKTFLSDRNYEFLKDKSLIIYLKLEYDIYKNINEASYSLNKKEFLKLSNIYENKSDIVIKYKENDEIINSILIEIKKFYKEVL